MAVSLQKTGWLQLFEQMRSPTGALARRFTIKPGGIYRGAKIAIDIQRFGEKVAIVVKKKTGPNLNDFDEFTTKEFTPPSYGEAFPLEVNELLDRMAGVDPFEAAYAEYASQLIGKIMKGFVLINDMIQRGVELQASQILQTGKLSLTDEAGDVMYEIDFAPKATHFPTVSTSWSSAATCTPIDDIDALAGVIRADGKVVPNRLMFGADAITNFQDSDQVKEALEVRRIELGHIDPSENEDGTTYHGRMWIGAYQYDLFSYPEYYEDPQTGDLVPYIDTDNVVVDSTRTRYDMTSAVVPLPLGPDPRVASLMPGRLSDRGMGIDVTPNLYCSNNGKQIMGELESRTLLVPVQIDGFGCLGTKAP